MKKRNQQEIGRNAFLSLNAIYERNQEKYAKNAIIPYEREKKTAVAAAAPHHRIHKFVKLVIQLNFKMQKTKIRWKKLSRTAVHSDKLEPK